MDLKNSPTFFKRNLTNMVAIAKAHHVEVVLSTWAHSPYFADYAPTADYQRGFQQNNAVVKEVARETRVKLLDFAEKMPKEKKYWADGRHVNEEGAIVKARLFADFIQRSGFLNSTSSAKGQ